MKTGWLLYDDIDLAVNRDFAAFFTESAAKRGLRIETVPRSRLAIGLGKNGAPALWLDGKPCGAPDFAVSRQRDALLCAQFERMGAPVFNGSAVCAVCNDKRRTHQFLSGRDIPMLQPAYGDRARPMIPPTGYPLIVKPARGHGGRGVALVNGPEALNAALSGLEDDYLLQRVAGKPGRDLRVYVLFGQIVAGVLRTAKSGVVSNYKLGGDIALHAPDAAERALAERVIAAFRAAGAELCFAGVDLLYDVDGPVLGEVEDVVGSRMLYQAGGPDVVGLYLDGLRMLV